MKLIDLAEPSDQTNQQTGFSLKSVLCWVVHSLKGPPHAGHRGEIPQYFTSSSNDDLLCELLVVVEVGEQREEGVVIEDAHIVRLVFVEDVAQVNLQQALNQTTVDGVQPFASLNQSSITKDK